MAAKSTEELDRIAEEAARTAGGQYRPTYNGWVNRETWNAALWMQNDEGAADAALDILRSAIDGADWDSRGTRDHETERRYLLNVAGDALREWWDETFGPAEASPLSDAWSYAIAWTDWAHVAEAIAEGHDIDHLPPERPSSAAIYPPSAPDDEPTRPDAQGYASTAAELAESPCVYEGGWCVSHPPQYHDRTPDGLEATHCRWCGEETTGLAGLDDDGSHRTHDHDPRTCEVDANAYPCPRCDAIEDTAGADHPEACSYTMKATRPERLDHYATRSPECNYTDMRAARTEAERARIAQAIADDEMTEAEASDVMLCRHCGEPANVFDPQVIAFHRQERRA